MPRRASLPGAEELFRSTTAAAAPEREPAPAPPEIEPVEGLEQSAGPALAPISELPVPQNAARPRHDKPRHEEKITFYCTASELDRLERARLTLRTDHRIASDRGRILRAALTEILEEFEAKGASSSLFRRLSAAG